LGNSSGTFSSQLENVVETKAISNKTAKLDRFLNFILLDLDCFVKIENTRESTVNFDFYSADK